MTTVQRGRTLALIGTGVVVVAGAMALLSPRGSTDVPMPVAAASASEVVETYLVALNAHDCDTAAQLAVASFVDTARQWCDDVTALDDAQLGEAIDQDPTWSGLSPEVEVAYVPVTFDLDWRLLRGDGSMPEGETTWGYLVTRSEADEPWRIFDNGVG